MKIDHHCLGFKHLLLIALVACYAFLGGAVFYHIEGPHENATIAAARRDARDRHWRYAYLFLNVTPQLCQNSSLQSDCFAAIVDVFKSYDNVTGLTRELQKGVWSWDYWNSVFYAATIFTTIGYGHMSCKTYMGRAATIVYALIGIPLTLVLLNDLGRLIFDGVQTLWNKLLRYILHFDLHNCPILFNDR